MWVLFILLVLLDVKGEKQCQLLLQPTEVELGLQVGVEFDKRVTSSDNSVSGKILQLYELAIGQIVGLFMAVTPYHGIGCCVQSSKEPPPQISPINLNCLVE